MVVTYNIKSIGVDYVVLPPGDTHSIICIGFICKMPCLASQEWLHGGSGRQRQQRTHDNYETYGLLFDRLIRVRLRPLEHIAKLAIW
jgi:hypothetical protein